MKYFRQSHAVYHTEYHIVWIPRFRRKILVSGIADYLITKLDEIRKWYPDVVFLERNIQPDHVHILILIPPKYSVSSIVNIIKSNTSKALKQKFPFLTKRVYLDNGPIWSVGYFVSTVGVNERIIRRYIQIQDKEDSGQAQLELN